MQKETKEDLDRNNKCTKGSMNCLVTSNLLTLPLLGHGGEGP